MIWGLANFTVSAFIITGTLFAYLQSKFPEIARSDRRYDMGVAIITGCLWGSVGPLGILFAAFVSGFWKYGWRLR